MADFFNADGDEQEAAAEAAREELEELRSLAMLAIAQARRTELALRDALDAEPEDNARLAELIARLEEERARADNLMARYRRREAEEEERLFRLGQIRLAEEVNERRRELRDAVEIAASTDREKELEQMEDEARSEAFKMDVLESLDAGAGYDRDTRRAEEEADLAARARELLEQPAVERTSEEDET